MKKGLMKQSIALCAGKEEIDFISSKKIYMKSVKISKAVCDLLGKQKVFNKN